MLDSGSHPNNGKPAASSDGSVLIANGLQDVLEQQSALLGVDARNMTVARGEQLLLTRSKLFGQLKQGSEPFCPEGQGIMRGTCCNEVDGLLQKSAERGQHVGWVLHSTHRMHVLHRVLRACNPKLIWSSLWRVQRQRGAFWPRAGR